MFVVHEDMTIYATRGDAVYFPVEKKVGNSKYQFQPGDVVRIKVVEKKNYSKVVLMKDFLVEEETTSVNIFLSKWDMKFGDIINKPVDYWYEVELNPDTTPDTFIGYDEDGAAIFKLFPEAKDVVEGEIPDPEENSAVSRMVVTFVNEYLGNNAETIVKEVLEKERIILNEVLKEETIATIVREIIDEGYVETFVQEIIQQEHIETITQQIIKEENIGTIVQEIIKPEHTTVLVEQVVEKFIERYPEAGKKGTTFTPKVDAEGNLSWTNDGGLENPAVVNIAGPKGEPGNPGEPGKTPVKGEDYFTEADKTDMINAMFAALSDLDEVSY